MTIRRLATTRQVDAEASTSVERETPVLDDGGGRRGHDGTAANFAGVVTRQEYEEGRDSLRG